ncbi:MAG: carbohydrate porin [Sphingomonas phyllosphaerae]|uniref:carbohydrate porin n=1 Tax=Sphingomonas phyllosphaerae TaxID=257003 RepID=UPI002FF7D030
MGRSLVTPNRTRKALSLAIASLLIGTPALAQDAGAAGRALSVDVTYKADVTGVAAGGVARGVRYLDNLDIVAEADLEKMAGWKRTTAHVSLLNNFGGRPNDLAGSIQGIDNIEVANPHFKLYEAWMETGLGSHVTLRAGLYDVNSEFYQNDAAGLLVSPMFGVGSELAATGTNGPAIFPSTALALRLKATTRDAYASVAVINARAGTLGDEHGIDLSGRDGALLIGEAGWTGRGKLAVGAWHYTQRQPTIIPPGLTPTDQRRYSQGVYVLAEQGLLGKDDETSRYLVGFVRLGVSDGTTTPFRGGWQGGVLLKRPFASRPAGVFSLGAGSGALSRNYRLSNPADLPPLRDAETILEATYSDEVAKGVTIQPDVQYVIHPSANPTIRNALVLGVRLTIGWANH